MVLFGLCLGGSLGLGSPGSVWGAPETVSNVLGPPLTVVSPSFHPFPCFEVSCAEEQGGDPSGNDKYTWGTRRIKKRVQAVFL